MQKLIYTFFVLGILHCIPCYARDLVSSEDEWIPGQPCYGPDDIPYATDGYVQEDYVIIRCDCGSESTYGTLSHVYHTGSCDSRWTRDLIPCQIGTKKPDIFRRYSDIETNDETVTCDTGAGFMIERDVEYYCVKRSELDEMGVVAMCNCQDNDNWGISDCPSNGTCGHYTYQQYQYGPATYSTRCFLRDIDINTNEYTYTESGEYYGGTAQFSVGLIGTTYTDNSCRSGSYFTDPQTKTNCRQCPIMTDADGNNITDTNGNVVHGITDEYNTGDVTSCTMPSGITFSDAAGSGIYDDTDHCVAN